MVVHFHVCVCVWEGGEGAGKEVVREVGREREREN